MDNSPLKKNLGSIFHPLIAYILSFKRVCANVQPSYEQVHQAVIAHLNESAKAIREKGLDPRDYDDGRFALCAWIDELILSAPWQYRAQWQHQLLQTEFYGTARAGEEFFDRLNSLSSVQSGVREIYYICLSLGFTGRFCQQGDDILLEQLTKSTLKSILGHSGDLHQYQKHPLFTLAYATEENSKALTAPVVKRQWSMGKIVLILMSPLVVLSLYILYSFVLNGVMDNLIARVGG